MNINENYLALTEYEGMEIRKKQKEQRTVLSDDAYAIVEALNSLRDLIRGMK